MAFSSVEGLLQAAGQVPLWRAVLEDDLRCLLYTSDAADE